MLLTAPAPQQKNTAPRQQASPASGLALPGKQDEKDRCQIVEKLLRDPLNTHFFESDSDEMEAFGIHTGTILIVDRSLKPEGGNIVIARIEGKWLVRQLRNIKGIRELITGQRDEIPIQVQDDKVRIWGVVTWTCSPQIERDVADMQAS